MPAKPLAPSDPLLWDPQCCLFRKRVVRRLLLFSELWCASLAFRHCRWIGWTGTLAGALLICTLFNVIQLPHATPVRYTWWGVITTISAVTFSETFLPYVQLHTVCGTPFAWRQRCTRLRFLSFLQVPSLAVGILEHRKRIAECRTEFCFEIWQLFVLGARCRAPSCTGCTILHLWCTMLYGWCTMSCTIVHDAICVVHDVVHHRAPGAQCYMGGA